MTKRNSRHSSSDDPSRIELPEQPELASIEPALETLSDLGARRDALRLMAELAAREAAKLDRELDRTLESHMRQLRALAVTLSSTHSIRVGG